MPIPRELNNGQFAEYMDAIRVLYLADEDFKSLCDDYCTVRTSIEQFKGTSVRDLERASEYEDLSVELAKEILYYVRNPR
ncbi:MAG TPA: hypothetical protein VFZ52_04240 [Chryseolinea sp.]